MGTQVSLLTLGNLQKVHTFLHAKKPKEISENFGSFIGSLAQAPDPKRSFIRYSVTTHPDKGGLEDVQKIVNAFKENEQLPTILKSLVNAFENLRLNDAQKQQYQTKLLALGQLVNLFPNNTQQLHNNNLVVINALNSFIQDIHQNKHTTSTVNKSIKEIEQTLANLFKSLFNQTSQEHMVNLFKKLPETIQLKIVETIDDSNPSNQMANFNNLLYANYLIHSKNRSFSKKLIQINASFAGFNPENNGFKLCKEFIKQLVNNNHLFINKAQQVLMYENNQYIQIPVADDIKDLINTFYKEKTAQIIEQAFTDGSTKSIATIIDSIPDNYLPKDLGKQLKNIEQTFGLKTLQSLGQIAKLEIDNFKAVLKKILRDPNIVNHPSLGPKSSFLQKLNALCGILTHDPKAIRLSGLLQENLGIPDQQLEALIKLRIKDNFSIHRINLKDEHNPDMVVFKQDNTYLDLMPINYPSQQALSVCQKMHAKNAHLEVIKDFIRKTEPQVLVDFIELIVRGDDINEESIKKNPEQTIVNLFKNKEIGTSKLLQNVSGDFPNPIPKEVYSAFIKLQLESNNFSVDKLQKRSDGTGEVTLKNTLSSSTRPIYVRCASDSYALLEAIQRQQVS